MRISFHLGLHATDEGRLIRSVLRSRGQLAEEGIHVPAPRHYRQILREALNVLGSGRASADAQAALLDAIADADRIRRLVVSHESLIAMPGWAVSEAGLYVQAPSRMRAIQNLFPDHEVEFFLALCNPATLVPILAAQAGENNFCSTCSAATAFHLTWLQSLRAIADAGLEMPVTVWCNEDTPLLWPELLRALSGYQGDAPLEGDMDLLAGLLTDEGLAALNASLAGDPRPGDPRADAAARRARVSDALLAHARHDQMEMEVTLPGWTEAAVARITERYLRDWEEICTLPGLTAIRP
jgi:hypothetical protein